MKRFIVIFIVIVAALSVVVANAQLLAPGRGGLLSPGLFTRTGTTVYLTNTADVLGDGTNPIANGQFTALTVGTVTISGRTLLITSPGNYPKEWKLLKTINFLDGKPAFDIVEKS